MMTHFELRLDGLRTVKLVHALDGPSYMWRSRHVHVPQDICETFFSHLQISGEDLVA